MTKYFKQSITQSTSKMGVMVMNNLLRDPKVAHSVVQKKSFVVAAGHQVKKFGQLFNTIKHGITTIIQGKAYDKVDRPT